jgi:hypothetical protein
VLALAGLYLLVTVPALWLLARARGRWLPRAALIVAVIGYAWVVWQALASVDGWPAHGEPGPAAVISYTADEPRWLYVWTVPLKPDADSPLGYRPAAGEPRAWRLPYSRQLHEELQRSLERGREQGRPVLLVRRRLRQGEEYPQSPFRAYLAPPTPLPAKEAHQ